MSLRHFKRLQLCATKTSDDTQDKEVCTTTCSNPDNDIPNNMQTFKTTFENFRSNNLIIETPAMPHDQINFSPEIGLELETNDTLVSKNHITCNKLSIKDKLQQWILAYNISKNSVNDLLIILRSEGLDSVNKNPPRKM